MKSNQFFSRAHQVQRIPIVSGQQSFISLSERKIFRWSSANHHQEFGDDMSIQFQCFSAKIRRKRGGRCIIPFY